jgi:hypothetical protein
LAQSATKTYNTSAAFMYISARRDVDNSVFNELLNNQAGVILSVLSVPHVSPEDGVTSHRNMSGVL